MCWFYTLQYKNGGKEFGVVVIVFVVGGYLHKLTQIN